MSKGTRRQSGNAYDAVVIGAGVTGLLLAEWLARWNIRVCLVETKTSIPGGATSTNQGWLHSGAYSAASIAGETEAIEVGSKCAFGNSFFRSNFPECLIEVEKPSMMLMSEGDDPKAFIERWNYCGIAAREISRKRFSELEPHVSARAHRGPVFMTRDSSFDARILAVSILATLARQGVRIYTDARLSGVDDGSIRVVQRSRSTTVRSRLFFYTAGTGIEQIAQRFFQKTVDQRFWKSHLAIYPRVLHHNVFFVRKGKIGVVHHGSSSVVALHGNSYQIPAADDIVNPEEVARISSELARLVPVALIDKASGVGCVKTDFGSERARSLANARIELAPNHIALAAGKMSGAPYLVLGEVRRHFQIGSSLDITNRPVDLTR